MWTHFHAPFLVALFGSVLVRGKGGGISIKLLHVLIIFKNLLEQVFVFHQRPQSLYCFWIVVFLSKESCAHYITDFSSCINWLILHSLIWNHWYTHSDVLTLETSSCSHFPLSFETQKFWTDAFLSPNC